MILSGIVDTLDASILTEQNDMTMTFSKAGASDMMSAILAGLSEGGVLITGLTTLQVIKTAIIAGITAVVFVRGIQPPQDVIDLAETERIPLLLTPLSMFVSCGRLYAAGMPGLTEQR